MLLTYQSHSNSSYKTIVLIAPKHPLCVSTVGPLRFITGTLNYLLSYRRKWLRMGYEETMALFEGRAADSPPIP